MADNPFSELAKVLAARRTHVGNPFAPAGIGSKRSGGLGNIFGLPPNSSPRAGGLDPFGYFANSRRGWTEWERLDVWAKGRINPMLSSSEWRSDAAGNLIRWSDYGKADSPHGWEIDHITPISQGGSNDISNLRPLRCSVNRALGGFLGTAKRNPFAR